jgi:hypothetical protein
VRQLQLGLGLPPFAPGDEDPGVMTAAKAKHLTGLNPLGLLANDRAPLRRPLHIMNPLARVNDVAPDQPRHHRIPHFARDRSRRRLVQIAHPPRHIT